MLGRPIQTLLPHWPGEHAEDANSDGAATAEAPMGTGDELLGRRKGGSRFPVELGLASIETARGVEGLLTIVDITERRRAEQRLVAAKEDAEAMLHAPAAGVG